MNSTLVALMVILGGQVQEAATFNTLEECETARANLVETQSFCYQKPEVDIDQTLDQLGNIMRKMKQQLDAISDKNKQST